MAGTALLVYRGPEESPHENLNGLSVGQFAKTFLPISVLQCEDSALPQSTHISSKVVLKNLNYYNIELAKTHFIITPMYVLRMYNTSVPSLHACPRLLLV